MDETTCEDCGHGEFSSYNKKTNLFSCNNCGQLKKRKPGRPPGSTSTRPTRYVIKQIRWTAQEWESIEAAAKAKGQTVAKYQRERILK